MYINIKFFAINIILNIDSISYIDAFSFFTEKNIKNVKLMYIYVLPDTLDKNKTGCHE